MKVRYVTLQLFLLSTFFFGGCNNTPSKDGEGEKKDTLSTESVDFVKYEDPSTGITFLHLPDWKFERKLRVATGEWEIVGNAPIHGYAKQAGIIISEREKLDVAVMEWWLFHGKTEGLIDNKVYIQEPIMHRYKKITYAANRAQIRFPKEKTILDYRVMAVSKKGKTIVIWERAEVGGLDGFEADGFNIIEETIDIEDL